MNARTRYDYLTRNRTQFLDVAVQCSKLTLPYLIQEDELSGRNTYRKLITPWQSVGAIWGDPRPALQTERTIVNNDGPGGVGAGCCGNEQTTNQ